MITEEVKDKDIYNKEIPNTEGNIDKITTPQKKELEVILLYPGDRFDNEGIPYAHNIISYKLTKMGIKNSIHQHGDEILADYMKQDNWSFRVFARTACYEYMPGIIGRNHKIHPKVKENSMTVIGGQASIGNDARSYMLEHGIDAINPAHAQPFFDFLEVLRGSETINRDTALASAKGLLATKAQFDVPEWKFPKLDRFPLMAYWTKWDIEKEPNANTSQDWDKKGDEKLHHILIPHYENCPNGCDFCSLMKIETNKIGDSIAELISEAKKPIPKIYFRWPTFQGKVEKSFRKILHAVKGIQANTPESNIIMDSKQFQEKYYTNTIKQLKEFNVTGIRLWLDAIDGKSAEAVGRRDHWRIRTDQEIQEEKAGILRFLKETQVGICGIDMLLTPFDTPETIEKILSFYQEVFLIGKERNIETPVYLLPLIPYPETKLHERYKDNIHLEDYRQLAGTSKHDLSIRKFDEEPFGLQCERCFLVGYNMMMKCLQKEYDAFRVSYLNFMSLSIAYQCLQGKKTLEEIDILPSEYANDRLIEAIFHAISNEAKNI